MIVVYHKALLKATLSVLISHENFKSDHPVQLYMKEDACLKHCKGDAVVQKKVTFVSIGYTGKGDVVVQRKTERIKH